MTTVETEGFRDEFPDVQDEDSEFEFLNVMCMGHSEAQLPPRQEAPPSRYASVT